MRYKDSGIKGLPSKPCPTCNDGVQNQGETGIDCGGPCTTCGKESVLLLSKKISRFIELMFLPFDINKK